MSALVGDPSALLGLVRHDVVAAFRAHLRPCAAELAKAAATPETWGLLVEESECLGRRREGSVAPGDLGMVCGFLAEGLIADAVEHLADACGLSADEWVVETRREIERARRLA